ncbi:glycosyltransferase family 4 protein [Lutibacter sp. A64]|uniref:glycosyltransferase family 4 protein n=1 Tax=Lutibacter sp. A64 TaxID=2918526 RepID=UPI001F053BE6|nr:glycosyltransferase family 4 protein [Lutibacter sp. A64]UMB54362.1 glycosyltransferase family 4 protein [Lutibacter sp. A64]
MKVVHILHELKYSGAEIMYVDAASVFQSLGCELSVVATAPNLGEFASKFKNARYTVFHKKIPKRIAIIKRMVYYYSFIKFLKLNQFEVVHNHSSGTYWGMALCAKLASIRSVHTFHNVFPTSWYSRWYHIWLRWSAKNLLNCRFQTISDSVYQNERTTFFNNTTLINNWYGNNRFYPAKVGEKNLVRKKLGIAEDTLVLISVGGCSHIKRHSDIIRALPQIIEKYPNTVYLHLGEGEDLCEEEILAKELNVTQYIRFVGNQNNVRNFLIASDIYIMPSKFEGISLTTIEAMACNIPTILYDVPGLRDFNIKQKNALLIKEDVDALTYSVDKLYKNNLLKEEIANKAKTFVDEKYNMEANAKCINKLYNKK